MLSTPTEMGTNISQNILIDILYKSLILESMNKCFIQTNPNDIARAALFGKIIEILKTII